MRYLAALLMVLIVAADGCKPTPLFVESFDVPDGLITNEYATWNPNSPNAIRSDVWELNSGSLFAQNGTGWSGVPDGASPDANSAVTTGSAVFRATTRDDTFGNVNVAFDLQINRRVTTPRTPAVAWDGIHVFLRYQSEEQLYYASVNRRDDSVVIKKKCPGGPTNGGTYYTLASVGGHPEPGTQWQHVDVGVVDRLDGTVLIEVSLEGSLVLSAVDSGVGCPVIAGTGATGIRGDNTEFHFDNFTVTNR